MDEGFDVDKLILVDCDGVLTNWSIAFNEYMTNNGHERKADVWCQSESWGLPEGEGKRHVDTFDTSAAIRYLPPYRDSIKYVNKLYSEYGYMFHVITAISCEKYTKRARRDNLVDLFGNVFTDIEFACHGKRTFLEPFRDKKLVWVDDNIGNVLLGHELGLDSILMEAPHNHKQIMDLPAGIHIVSSWKEIYEYVTTK